MDKPHLHQDGRRMCTIGAHQLGVANLNKLSDLTTYIHHLDELERCDNPLGCTQHIPFRYSDLMWQCGLQAL